MRNLIVFTSSPLLTLVFKIISWAFQLHGFDSLWTSLWFIALVLPHTVLFASLMTCNDLYKHDSSLLLQ